MNTFDGNSPKEMLRYTTELLKLIKFGRNLKISWFIAVAFFIVYNIYFGFNLKPESPTEEFLDNVTSFLFSALIVAEYYKLNLASKMLVGKFEDDLTSKAKREIADHYKNKSSATENK